MGNISECQMVVHHRWVLVLPTWVTGAMGLETKHCHMAQHTARHMAGVMVSMEAAAVAAMVGGLRMCPATLTMTVRKVVVVIVVLVDVVAEDLAVVATMLT